MTLINCGVKLRSKDESIKIIRERLEQLKLEGKTMGQEGKALQAILEAGSK